MFENFISHVQTTKVGEIQQCELNFVNTPLLYTVELPVHIVQKKMVS